jgi:hypothetical protein
MGGNELRIPRIYESGSVKNSFNSPIRNPYIRTIRNSFPHHGFPQVHVKNNVVGLG